MVVFVEWDKDGALTTRSIHQYGSATQDTLSPHYDDQVEMFADEMLKDTYFEIEALEAHKESRITVPFNHD